MKNRKAILRHTTSLCSHVALLTGWIFFTMATFVDAANAAGDLPGGAQSVAGKSDFDYSTPNNLKITQSTNTAVVLWHNGFDIGAGNSVNIYTPGASSSSLYKVVDGNPTLILGTLTSTGHLMLVNGNSIFIGKGARVDAAGLILSTNDIRYDKAGKPVIGKAGSPTASIINKGIITAAQGGLVALIAPGIRNEGVINARLGTVVLGAGESFTLDFYGDKLYSFAVNKPSTQAAKDENGKPMTAAVTNTGVIAAKGGSVYITASAAKEVVDQAINTTGIIDASSAHMEGGTVVLDGGEGAVNVAGKINVSSKQSTGGSVTITGQDIALTSTATIDASGKTGGGKVRVGGDFHGQGNIKHAATVVAAKGSVIDVSATDKGNGGTAVVWSDKSTDFAGNIKGTGGKNGGNGGQAEVSSTGTDSYTGLTDLSAANGKRGGLLLDPTDYTIGSTEAATITANLATTDVTVSATHNIDDNFVLAWGTTSSLTLDAGNDLNINATISSNNLLGNGSQGAVTLNGGHNVNIGNGGGVLLNTLKGDINVNATNVSIVNGSVIFGGNSVVINNTGTFNSTNANSLNGNFISVHQNTPGTGTIQNAIDAVGSHSNALVTVGVGIWDENVLLTKSNLTLNGSGQNNTIIKPTTVSLNSVQNAPSGNPTFKPIILAQNATNVGVQNLTVDGSNIVLPVNTGIELNGIVYNNASGTIANITTNNAGTHPINVISDSSVISDIARTVNVNNSIINRDNRTLGGQVLGYTALSASGNLVTLNASGNTVTGGLGSEPAVLYANGAGGSFSGNTLNVGSGAGIGLIGANGVTISGNTASGTDGQSSFVYSIGAGSNNIIILANGVTNMSDGVYGKGSNWTVNSNIMSGGGNGIQLDNVSGTNGINGNTLNGYARGITLNNTAVGSTVSVNGNTINNASLYAIRIANSGLTFINANQIHGAAQGIVVNGGAADIEVNTLDGITQQGIVINNGSGTSLIESNSITGTGGAMQGIQILGGGADIGNGGSNTVNNFAFGIDVENTNGNFSVIANNHLNNNKRGIYTLMDLGAIITNNLIDGSQYAILGDTSNNASIFNNTLTHVGSVGIAASGDNISVQGNTISANVNGTGTGIALAGNTGNTFVSGNTVSNFAKGIDLNSINNASLVNNTLNGNTTAISNVDSNGTLIALNTINDASTGIFVDPSSGVTIDNNTMTGVTGNGVTVIGGSNNIITNNSITGTGGAIYGIQLLSLTGINKVGDVGAGNTINNFAFGIDLENTAGTTTISSNTLNGNKRGIYLLLDSNAHVIRNHIDGGIMGIAGDTTTGSVIDSNILTGMTSNGIVFNGSNQHITNNTITAATTGTGTGIILTGATGILNEISGNSVNSFATGIQLDGSSNALVGGNTLNNNTTGINVSNGSNSDLIVGNNIASGTNGIIVTNGTNETISGNIINSSGIGMTLNGGTGYTVTNNTLTGIGGAVRGIQALNLTGTNQIGVAGLGNGNSVSNFAFGITDDFGSAGTVITNNTLNNNKRGVYLTLDNGIVVSNNSIAGSQLGIGGDGANNVTASKNTLTGITATGIAFNGANETIIGNSVTAATTGTGTGIALFSATGTNVIGSSGLGNGNTVTGFADGIHLDNTKNASIAFNTLASNTTGISLANASNNTFIANNTATSGTNGINVSGSTNAAITANNLTVSGSGITIAGGSGHTVFGNTLAGGGIANHGIQLYSLTGTNAIGSAAAGQGNNISGFAFGITDDSSVAGTTIAGNTLNTNKRGVYLTFSNGVTVSGNSIANSQLGIAGDGANNITASGNTLTGITDTGIAFNGANETILGNSITAGIPGTAGIALYSATGINVIGNGSAGNGNTVTGFTNGILLDHTSNAQVLFNTLDSNQTAITLQNASNNTNVSLNTVANGFDGILVTDSNGENIAGNTITISDDGIGIFGGTGHTIVGNTINGTGAGSPGGIFVTDLTGTNVIGAVGIGGGNTMNNVDIGIEVENTGAGTTITNNTVNNAFFGIVLGLATPDDGLVVTGNTIHNAVLGIGGASDNTVISDNTLTGITEAGIGLSGANETMQRNSVTADASASTTSLGIFLFDATGTNLIGGAPSDGNTVTGFADGIHLDNSTAVITSNTLASNTNSISLDNGSNGVSVTGNTVTSGTNGITVSGGSSTEVINSNSINVSSIGISIDGGSGHTITGNIVTGTGGAVRGIQVLNLGGFNNIGGATAADGNTVSNFAFGITADNTSPGLLIGNNTLTNNKRAVYLTLSTAVGVINNTISGSQLGIGGDTSANTVVTGNTLTGITDTGIALSGANQTITGNSVTAAAGATGAGIGLFSTSGNNIIGDTGNGNTVTGFTTGIQLDHAGTVSVDSNALNGNTTGLEASGGSTVTVTNTAFNGGVTGVQLSDAGTTFGFGGNTSSFTGQSGNYFTLQNNVMFGGTIDASQQIFDGTRAANFSALQLATAELRTTDVADLSSLGDVFYTTIPIVIPPVTPAVGAVAPLDQLVQDRSLGHTAFSYSGQTIASFVTDSPYIFRTQDTRLSLLAPSAGATTVAAAAVPAGTSAAQLANLAPAAGGDVNQLAALAPSAGTLQADDCGNGFLSNAINAAGKCAAGQQ